MEEGTYKWMLVLKLEALLLVLEVAEMVVVEMVVEVEVCTPEVSIHKGGAKVVDTFHLKLGEGGGEKKK